MLQTLRNDAFFYLNNGRPLFVPSTPDLCLVVGAEHNLSKNKK